MLSSKEDCGETLKAEIRALRKKYGGFAVDLMNRVCQIEDGDSGDPDPESGDGNWNTNWPDVNRLADLYTDHDSDPDHYDFYNYNGESFKGNYQPDPTIFLWTINALMAKNRELNRRFIINSTVPDWAKLLTSNLSERNLSQIDFYVDSTSEKTSLPIWARESNVMFKVGAGMLGSLEERMYPIVADLIRRNRVTVLSLDGRSIQHLVPALASLKTMKHPALEVVGISTNGNRTEYDPNGILKSLTGLKSVYCLHLSTYAQRQCLDYFVDHFLTHPDCKIKFVQVECKAKDLIIERSSKGTVTPLAVDLLLKMVRNCPTILRVNDYDPKIWRYESSVRQHMVSFFISLQQNQVGRELVLDPSCYRTSSSHGIFSHLLDRAYNRLDAKKKDFDYIQYEEGVHHDQDHPYDGIYFMIKELAVRGILGIAGDVSEEDESFIARPSKICRR